MAASCKDKNNKTIYVFGGITVDVVDTNNYITDNNKQIRVVMGDLGKNVCFWQWSRLKHTTGVKNISTLLYRSLSKFTI